MVRTSCSSDLSVTLLLVSTAGLCGWRSRPRFRGITGISRDMGWDSACGLFWFRPREMIKGIDLFGWLSGGGPGKSAVWWWVDVAVGEALLYCFNLRLCAYSFLIMLFNSCLCFYLLYFWKYVSLKVWWGLKRERAFVRSWSHQENQRCKQYQATPSETQWPESLQIAAMCSSMYRYLIFTIYNNDD